MSEDSEHSEAVVSVESGGGHAAGPTNVVDPNAQLMVLTWITFGLVAWLLHKFAWKPLLRNMEQREETINAALEEAKKANARLGEIDAQCRQMSEQAETRGREIIAAAKTAADSLRIDMEQQAKADASAMLETTRKELAAAVVAAREQLRKDSAEIACGIAERIVREELDSGRDMRVAREYLEQLDK